LTVLVSQRFQRRASFARTSFCVGLRVRVGRPVNRRRICVMRRLAFRSGWRSRAGGDHALLTSWVPWGLALPLLPMRGKLPPGRTRSPAARDRDHRLGPLPPRPAPPGPPSTGGDRTRVTPHVSPRSHSVSSRKIRFTPENHHDDLARIPPISVAKAHHHGEGQGLSKRQSLRWNDPEDV